MKIFESSDSQNSKNINLASAALKAAGLDPNKLNAYADDPNEFLNQIQNKVIAQYVLTTLVWENPYTKYFLKTSVNVGNGVEILGVNPVIPTDYDESKYTPDQTDKNTDVKTQVITTKDKKVFPMMISTPILMAAFSSLDRMGQFIAEYTRQVQQSVQIWLWNTISKDLKDIKNVIELGKDLSLEDQYMNIMVHSDQMSNPSKDYNVDGSKWKLNATPKNDQILITSPQVNANWRLKVFAALYNIGTLTPQDNFGSIIVTTNLDAGDYCYLISKDAYYMDFRIDISEPQSWAKNLMTTTYYHLWVRRGLVNNANGVKFQISTKNPPK